MTAIPPTVPVPPPVTTTPPSPSSTGGIVASHPEWLAFALAAIIIICITVLVAINKTVPSIFGDVLLVTLGVGGGVMKSNAP